MGRPPGVNAGKCKVDDCEEPSRARGWCQKHYKRWRKTGSPDGGRVSQRHDQGVDTVHADFSLAARYTELRLAIEKAAALLEMAEYTDAGDGPQYRDEARRVLAEVRAGRVLFTQQ